MTDVRPAIRPGNVARLVAYTLQSSRLIRFLAVGLVNTAFGYAVFLVALRLGAVAAVALMISTLAGIAFNFQTSRHIVFRSRRAGLTLRFSLVYVAVFAINCTALAGLRRMGLPNGMGQAVMVLPMAMLAFAMQRGFVFKTRGKA